MAVSLNNHAHDGIKSDIAQIIINGVPEKGMLSWKTLLSPKEVGEIISFIASIKGSNPENAKEPQGKKRIAAASQVSKYHSNMNLFIQYSLLLYLIVNFGTTFVWPSYRVWKKTGYFSSYPMPLPLWCW